MSDRHGERVSPQRRLTADYMRMAGRRSTVHGLVEVDVTDARDRIRELHEETGERLSFTAFVVSCLAAAVDDHPEVQTYHDWRGRRHRFDDVDVNVMVETTVDGERLGVPHVVRTADRRSLRSIHDEIRRVQQAPGGHRRPPAAAWADRLPGLVRRQVWRLPQLFPRRWKQLAGTVAVTSVGMFGSGGGWAVAPTNYSLQVTVGGIGERPVLRDGDLVEREYLGLTVTVDHDVVDGAAAARFVGRLTDLLEAADGLDDPDV